MRSNLHAIRQGVERLATTMNGGGEYGLDSR
jgi:hypothetical protein